MPLTPSASCPTSPSSSALGSRRSQSSAAFSESDLRQVLGAVSAEASHEVTFKVQGPFTMVKGLIPGESLLVESMTVEEAMERARSLEGCRGFTYQGEIDAFGEVEVKFMGAWSLSSEKSQGWTAVCYDKAKDNFPAEPERVVLPPSQAQLRMMLMSAALPFVGFGFLDNFIMIIFGELIDSTLCVSFSLSTMAAAAIGNTFSDVAGIFSGGLVESMAVKAGYGEPKLDEKQKVLPVTKMWQYSGQVLGIVSGCLLGSCPLLWIDAQAAERYKREKEKAEIFETVVHKVRDILHAEAAALVFVDKDRRYLSAHQTSDNLPHFTFPIHTGWMGHVIETGHFVNIADVRDEKHYDPKLHDSFAGSGISVSSILSMPIHSGGEVKGTMLLINKEGDASFTAQDEDVLSAVCSHISAELGDSKANFAEVIDLCETSMRKMGAPEWSWSHASQRRTVMYEPALEGIRNVVDAESAALLLLDREAGVLETQVIDGPMLPHTVPLGKGVSGKAVEKKKVISAAVGSPLIADVSVNKPSASAEADGADEIVFAPQGEPLDVRSAIAVPLFDTCRKCLGVIKCVNKRGAAEFSEADEDYLRQVAAHIEIVLEGPDAGLRRILSLSRHHLQRSTKSAVDSDCKVLMHLIKAENLPTIDVGDQKMDPYVTMSITNGDPLLHQERGLEQRVWKARNQDRQLASRRWAKSQTQFEDCNAQWNEKIAVRVSNRLRGQAVEELYLHLLLWDYDAMKPDCLIAQASVPLSSMPSSSLSEPQCLQLRPIVGREGKFNLQNSRIWASFIISDQEALHSTGTVQEAPQGPPPAPEAA